MASRDSFDLIKQHINLKTYSKQFQILFGTIDSYYQRDTDAGAVNRDILLALVAEQLKNDKHLKDFTEIVDGGIAANVSTSNVDHLVLRAKEKEIGEQLAVAIVNGAEHSDLLEQYNQIKRTTSLEELNERGLEIYSGINIAELIDTEHTNAEFLKLFPTSLNNRLDGGLKKGNHVVVFGRPESGKSCFVINAACGFARQGYKGLYFINEDRPQDILLRCASNLSGLTKHQIIDDPVNADSQAKLNGFGLIEVISCAPGNLAQIERCIEKYEPDWMVIDQLRNIQVRDDNRVIQLEKAATGIRTLAKKYNVATISVTQAGDSADGKAVLDMGDVDFSNTGIPAQADLMVGIGVTDELEMAGHRYLSLPKNKLGGVHESFPVKIDTLRSRMKSV